MSAFDFDIQVGISGEKENAGVSMWAYIRVPYYSCWEATLGAFGGLNTVDGEDPPRILHFNPRLKGDWSGKPGFSLEDATGLSLNGDIDVDSVFAASLPATYSHFAPQKHLDMSN
ncbi:putative beta-1,3-galactosyltransferase 17 [Capsicum chinense]|nr:putative beta-1,3-galactosyltransferase 17 [Capsicum chinense]